jgi:hypothetical protein
MPHQMVSKRGVDEKMARNYMEKKRYAGAVYTLRPLAFNPHGDNSEAATMLKEATDLATASTPTDAAKGTVQ